jgi:hypothetical protein
MGNYLIVFKIRYLNIIALCKKEVFTTFCISTDEEAFL